MIFVILKGAPAWVYVARTKDGKVFFNYNSAAKGGVAIEKNRYKSFDLSTSQEKLYETQALKNVIEKIDNSWWSSVKPYLGAAIIILGAMIVSIVMIQQARHVEPVPQPEVELFNNVTHAMIQLSQSNQELVKEIATQYNITHNNKQINKPPR